MSTRLVLLAGTAALVLAAGSTVAFAAANGAFNRHSSQANGYAVNRNATCSVPTLPGAIVDVTATDQGAMMGGSRSGHRSSGMLQLTLSPSTVTRGTVSLRVTNAGMLTHEVVVLPLAAGQAIGSRTVGSKDTVDETASAGEVSRTCGAGAGDGISRGATGWTTLTLPPGRYELLCNLPGHYAASMFVELNIT